jgi:cysteinyl-tRNA synthetase
MRLYNTPAHEPQELELLNPPTVTIYTCGPTVYDYPHIGNWFTFIRYDLLVRVLKEAGFEPKWAFNITDVGHLVSDADEGEDKLEKGARREGKTAREIADYYTDYFMKGLERLNFLKPDYLPRATDYIDQQIELIKQLETKGLTYKISDGIYFDTAKYPSYGDFAHLNLDEQQQVGRVEANSEKHQPFDFALWKFSPEHQSRDMEWDSPWGKGFPGWHIECSAMIKDIFGDTIDIHGGGVDHIPVHHTNEIAQSSSASGKPLAKYWFHANHILINDQKIAKSEGNGLTLEDIQDRGYSPRVLRLLVLQSHYRTQSTFSWDSLEAAANKLMKFQDFTDLRYQPLDKVSPLGQGFADKAKERLMAELNDDLSTPRALAAVEEIIDQVNQVGGVHPDSLEDFVAFIVLLDNLFGLDFLKSGDLNEAQKKLLNQRSLARASQNWTLSDQLRDELAEQGIEINDTDFGQIWQRK